MGGSGGGGYFSGSSSPEDLRRKLKEATDHAADAEFASETNSLIGSLLSRLNSRDTEQVRSYLDDIESALRSSIDGVDKLLFGGSVAKHTYVDGLSDVDALVLLDRDELHSTSPDRMLDAFYHSLRKQLKDANVTKGTLAVTVTIGDTEIQLLPAAREGGRFRIADATGLQWSSIDPRVFADKLTRANTLLNQKLVPTIKLAKSAISNLPEDRQLSGYHVEALATEVLSGYSGSVTPKNMLRQFFERAAERVRYPIGDVTGQSNHIDEYLGAAESTARKLVSDSLARIARRMDVADRSRLLELWRGILSPD